MPDETRWSCLLQVQRKQAQGAQDDPRALFMDLASEWRTLLA